VGDDAADGGVNHAPWRTGDEPLCEVKLRKGGGGARLVRGPQARSRRPLQASDRQAAADEPHDGLPAAGPRGAPGLRARPERISARPVQGRRARDAHRGWEAAFAANALAFYAAHGITVRRVSAVKW